MLHGRRIILWPEVPLVIEKAGSGNDPIVSLGTVFFVQLAVLLQGRIFYSEHQVRIVLEGRLRIEPLIGIFKSGFSQENTTRNTQSNCTDRYPTNACFTVMTVVC